MNTNSDILRFSTAGSVDDGKSTLIGRLLYDSKSIFEDQLTAIEKSTQRKGREGVDLSLLTDGLAAEREQGITIDVAYRYFATPKRKFIIADTPGHEQYTRNMVTGASTADLAIILIDAQKGLSLQSRRHVFISTLLGIRHILVCVNKMDLVDFSEERFNFIENDFRLFVKDLKIHDLRFVPLSALHGDNVVTKSSKMPWYQGSTVMNILETIPIWEDDHPGSFRFPVQYVNRPNADLRAYCGQVAGGSVRPGDDVLILPLGKKNQVKSVMTFDGDLAVAFPPQSVAITLEEEMDISRGDVVVALESPPHVAKAFFARLCWMHEEPLMLNHKYLLKHGCKTVKVLVPKIEHCVDVNTLDTLPTQNLSLNDIGLVQIKSLTPLIFDSYARNRQMGCFILIDETTNNTVAAGMIEVS
jgi:sulfate adenylyltransferase subunit 1